MDSGHLNYFLPFRSLAPNHENQLTRGLLVVLRYSPVARVAWLRLVAPDRELHMLPSPMFVTQQRAIRYATEDMTEAELVSLFLGPEQPMGTDELVVAYDRDQVLDAVIDFGGELIVVIENKVAPAEDWQARYLNLAGSRVAIADGQTRVVLLWRVLLEAFIALRERNLVSGAEAMLLDDFISYVEDYFPALGPFRTLSLCNRDRARLTRRLRQILGEVTGHDATVNWYGPFVLIASDLVSRAHLRVSDDSQAVDLAFAPADTLSQARSFYRHPDVISAVTALAEKPGWEAGPNFHFGSYTTGYCWTTGPISFADYLELWTDRIAAGEGAVSAADWDRYWQKLVDAGVADPADRREFDKHFTNTNRRTATPRPGVYLRHRWPLPQAERLDSARSLVGEVRDRLTDALDAFQATVDRSSSTADA